MKCGDPFSNDESLVSDFSFENKLGQICTKESKNKCRKRKTGYRKANGIGQSRINRLFSNENTSEPNLVIVNSVGDVVTSLGTSTRANKFGEKTFREKAMKLVIHEHRSRLPQHIDFPQVGPRYDVLSGCATHAPATRAAWLQAHESGTPSDLYTGLSRTRLRPSFFLRCDFGTLHLRGQTRSATPYHWTHA